eukprot:CAMPEP_0119034368 /NCGR_PEP_ID=MMETSP1177-20130426/1350_1 /TAXON_ID=2985 /ORGANISM="Ochromonas sp, Strain CCMP1899" /LENGTH=257 /DNA_ID=CAMNT_0006991749 /DNA_START=751 /DNA_END=1524 /DNA_ORIENTATION=-
MAHCAQDVRDIMAHVGVDCYHTVIGWSLGAQVALGCCSTHPSITENLFLLNTSTGTTIHYVFQTVGPFPHFLRKGISNTITSGINALLPLIPTNIWDFLKAIVYSSFFRIFLECLAFFGGFPPEQPPYFHEYMKDVFHTRNQTKGLLRLILALDEPLAAEAFVLRNNAVIVSGLPDVLTGAFHGWRLARTMPNSSHVTFTMASHFLLLEWPDLLAKEVSRLLAVPSLNKEKGKGVDKKKKEKVIAESREVKIKPKST